LKYKIKSKVNFGKGNKIFLTDEFVNLSREDLIKLGIEISFVTNECRICEEIVNENVKLQKFILISALMNTM